MAGIYSDCSTREMKNLSFTQTSFVTRRCSSEFVTAKIFKKVLVAVIIIVKEYLLVIFKRPEACCKCENTSGWVVLQAEVNNNVFSHCGVSYIVYWML